jgi:nicotinic acid mononucleotide adenylyltransferase
MVINDPWYKELEEYHDTDFCIEAGYFEENQPWAHKYSHAFMMPSDTTLIQYSGAFHPLHEGHMDCITKAIDAVVDRTDVKRGAVILHVDHGEYRHSKGYYADSKFKRAISDHIRNYTHRGFIIVPLFEDNLIFNCSRNFTRLYSELLSFNNDVYFLSGGDRANYALTFINKGKCIIAGRDTHENFEKYKTLQNDRIWFLNGNHPASSTAIRNLS